MEISIKWNICRVCLQEETDASPNMKPIFKESRMAKRIYECSGIEMSANDGLPEKICRKCLVTLKYAIIFRSTCRQSHKYLRSVMEQAKATNFLEKVDKPNKRLDETAELLETDVEVVSDGDCEFLYTGDDDFLQSATECEELEPKPKIIKNEYLRNIEKQKDSSQLRKTALEKLEIKKKREEGPTYRVKIIPDNKLHDASADDEVVTSKDNEKKIDQSIIEKTTSEIEEDENRENYFVLVAQEDEMKGSPEYLHDDDDEEEYNSTDGANHKTAPESEFVDLQMENISEMNEEYEIDEEDIHYKGSTGEEFCSDEDKTIIERTTRTCLKTKATSPTVQATSISLEKTIFSSRGRKRLKKEELDHKLLVCEICGNHFNNRNLLTCHMRTHRKEKGFECELCLKRFSTACNLSAHMRIHTGEKPFECQFCQRRFTDRSTHIKHERTHTNEKPFQCDICRKSFSLSTSLRAHELIHTGEKRHRCDLCKKAFKLRHQLKAHLNTQLHRVMAVERKIDDDELVEIRDITHNKMFAI